MSADERDRLLGLLHQMHDEKYGHLSEEEYIEALVEEDLEDSD